MEIQNKNLKLKLKEVNQKNNELNAMILKLENGLEIVITASHSENLEKWKQLRLKEKVKENLKEWTKSNNFE